MGRTVSGQFESPPRGPDAPSARAGRAGVSQMHDASAEATRRSSKRPERSITISTTVGRAVFGKPYCLRTYTSPLSGLALVGMADSGGSKFSNFNFDVPGDDDGTSGGSSGGGRLGSQSGTGTGRSSSKKSVTASRIVEVSHGGVVWCGVAWCGMVWCGVVWCGMV